jgi:glycosyltransferase involved in cell wall biosynthesis
VWQATVKAGFYSNALPVAGGGEKYFLTIVEEAVKWEGSEVILMAPIQPRPEEWRRLGISLTEDSFRWKPVRDRMIMRETRGLDLFVCMRSVPPVSRADRSVALIQFPGRMPHELGVAPRTPRELARRLKVIFERRTVASYDLVVCNSAFTQRHVVEALGHPETVIIYPPVDPAVIVAPKGPIILSVGRLWEGKRQDFLIQAFRRLMQRFGDPTPWELHVAGGHRGDEVAASYLRELRDLAAGCPVVFHPNASRALLQRLYARASVFWHAAGVGSEHYPRRQEHFGITTVEAMAYGCVPIVIGLGGQPEIVTHGVDGLLWRSLDELVALTDEVIASPELRGRLSGRAMITAKRFSADRFRREARELVLTATRDGGDR